MSMGPLYILLEEVSIHDLCPFWNWIVCLPHVESYDFFMYFGDQTLVRGITGKYVFPYGWFPFYFYDGFSSLAEAFNFDVVSLVYLFFISLASGDILAKILLHEISEIVLSTFFSRAFMMS